MKLKILKSTIIADKNPANKNWVFSKNSTVNINNDHIVNRLLELKLAEKVVEKEKVEKMVKRDEMKNKKMDVSENKKK